MKHIVRVHGYSHESCKRVRLSVEFDDGKLLNAERIARSSMVGWGPWQTSAKVQTKWGPAWFVTTAGHGGYILVTQAKETPFGGPLWQVESSAGNVYVHEFEEDCNWAVLEYHDAKVREWARLRISAHRTPEAGPTPEAYLEAVRKTLLTWRPEVLGTPDVA